MSEINKLGGDPGLVTPAPAVVDPPVRYKEVSLESAKLHVGSPMQMQTTPDAPKYSVRLVGFYKNNGVIVTPPTINGEMAMLRELSPFTVRFFSGQNAFAFSTSVVKHTNIPYPMLHLSYPKSIQMQQVRQNPRIEVDLSMVAEDAARGIQLPCKIYDLSASGASIAANQPLGKISDRFVAKFKVIVQEHDAKLEIICQIRNVIPPPGDGSMKYGYGVSFHEVDQDMQFALSAYVSGTMLDKK